MTKLSDRERVGLASVWVAEQMARMGHNSGNTSAGNENVRVWNIRQAGGSEVPETGTKNQNEVREIQGNQAL